MALVLAIDIRNTRTRIGLALDGRLVSQWAVPTDPDETADGAVACVLGFFDALARGLAPIEEGAPGAIDLPESAPLADGAIIASVIPALTGVWADAARRLTDARPLTVGPGLKTGLKMNFSDPVAVGADRVAEMVGAKSTYGAPALVIDLGTSTTFELLDETGAFRGGIIAPGMKLGAQALEVARIDGLIDMIWADCGYTTPVILVGQDAETIAALMAHAVTVDQTLALRGLLELYTANTRR